MLDKLKVALVLVVIGALSGITIYGVNVWAEPLINENRIIREEGFYKELFDLDESEEITYEKFDLDNGLEQEIIIYDSNGDVVGYIYKGTEKNNYGDITVLVGIKADNTISKAVISSTTNTVTFVQTIKSKYIDKFIGQDIEELVIDSKTGATYTYTSVVNIVNAASEYYLESRGE